MATRIGTYDYLLFSNDKTFLSSIYSRYTTAMAFITSKIDGTGMLDVTGVSDWGRLSQGGHNTEANIMLYRVLTSGSQIATWQGDTTSAVSWGSLAATLKDAANALNYDIVAGYVVFRFPGTLLTSASLSKTAILMAAFILKMGIVWR